MRSPGPIPRGRSAFARSDAPPLHEIGEAPDPRFTFANERTFLAWNRTALALITAGFAAVEFVNFGVDALRYVLGLPLIVLGASLALTSYHNWDRNERCLRLDEPLPYPRTPRILALAVAAAAGLAVVAVIVDAIFG